MHMLACAPEEGKPMDDDDPLGALILNLLPLVHEDRANHRYQGPTEQWLDALAVCWARGHLPQPGIQP